MWFLRFRKIQQCCVKTSTSVQVVMLTYHQPSFNSHQTQGKPMIFMARGRVWSVGWIRYEQVKPCKDLGLKCLMILRKRGDPVSNVSRWLRPKILFLWMLLEKHPLCHRMCKVTKETSGANKIMRNAIDSTSITFRWTSRSSRQSVFSTTTIAKKTEENGSQTRKSDYLVKIGRWTSELLLGWRQ